MQIRPFMDTDEDAVVALWTEAGITRPWNDPRKDIRRKGSVQPESFLVAEVGDTIVGVVMAGYDGHRGWINYLAVSDAARGTGAGRRLMETAEQTLAALGCPKVQLQVRPDNPDVVGFYEHLGYDTYQVIDMGKRLIAD